MKKISKRQMVIAGAGVAALVAGSLTLSTANAAEESQPTLKSLSSLSASKLATKLTGDLKGSQAGSYYDAKTKKLVVNVTDQAAKKTVEAAGAQAKVVQHTMAELNSSARPARWTSRTTRSSSPRTAPSRARSWPS